jgi:hypothetical protein
MRRSILVMGGIAAAVIFGGIAAGCGSPAQTASAVTVSAVPVTSTVKQTVTVTTTAPAPAPLTVTAPPPAPVTVTVTAAPAAPAASADPGGAKANGKFLVGSQVSSGTWQCDKAGDLPYWSVNAQDNSIIDNGLDTIAIVSDSGYTLTLQGCSSVWNKVG